MSVRTKLILAGAFALASSALAFAADGMPAPAETALPTGRAAAAPAATGVAPAAEAPAVEYTLEAYLAKVEADNPDLMSARKALEQARQSVVQARSALLPGIGLQGGYTRNLLDIEQSTAVSADTSTGRFNYMELDTNFDNEYSLGIGVSQKIFDAAAFATVAQACKGRDIRAEAFETARRSVRTAAKKLYAQAQLTQAVLEVMETSEKASAENYRSVSLKAEAGVSTELDALLAEVDWKQKVPSTAEARKNRELVMIAFKNLAGIPLAAAVTLSGDSGDVPPMPLEVELSAVLLARPDYRIALLSKDLSDIANRAAYGTFLPTVSASFSYGAQWMSGLNITGAAQNYDVAASSFSIKASLPLFTGFYRTSLMKSAAIAQQQSAIDLSEKRDAIERELAGLRLRLDEARTRIESAKVLESATKRATALAKAAFDNDLGTQLQVTDASSKYDQARLAMKNAIYTYRATCYDWDYAIGKAD